MQQVSMSGGFTNPPVQSATAFRAAMTAMARPGSVHMLEGATAPAPMSRAAATLILTLCDADTGLYLAPGHDMQDMRDWVTFHTGAPIVDASAAAFAIGTWQALLPLDRFPVGNSEYPDRSATLIVDGADAAQAVRFSGPGVNGHLDTQVPDAAALNAIRLEFPLGLDLFFAEDAQVRALPRSTQLEVL